MVCPFVPPVGAVVKSQDSESYLERCPRIRNTLIDPVGQVGLLVFLQQRLEARMVAEGVVEWVDAESPGREYCRDGKEKL